MITAQGVAMPFTSRIDYPLDHSSGVGASIDVITQEDEIALCRYLAEHPIEPIETAMDIAHYSNAAGCCRRVPGCSEWKAALR